MSADIPVILIINERKRVKKVKLKTKPRIIPNGFLFPSPTAPDKTTGSIGKMHGERMVTIPPKNEKNIKSIIGYFLPTLQCLRRSTF